MEENKTVAPSSLVPSSLPQTRNHHVFSSFHGPDVRKGFLAHLLKEFKSKGIDPFIDNNIERSKSIVPELKEAIRGSRIAIALLSKNYASSTWCLDELVDIIKCREELTQTVMVIFYELDPTDVKKQTGEFGKVFKKTCKGKTKDAISKWKQALGEVAKIAGYNSRKWDDEAEMIEAIASDVSNKLNISAPSSDFDGLIGMESHMNSMGRLLRPDSKEVRIIGIMGPSGIGKTTIARFLYNQHFKDFQLSVFMENIKRKYAAPTCSDDYDVKLYLQKMFMSKMISHEGFKIPHLGTVKDKLKEKKVFVVLDDVDWPVQLETIVKETSWFGPGSRIIITTQHRKLLQAVGINHTYKVHFPSSYEALQMFCGYAFGQKSPKDDFRELAREVVKFAGELPLGLRVMGSYFRGISQPEWTKAISRLKTRIDGETENHLKLSYDALCAEDKNLFLHIACFFNNESIDTVECCLANSPSVLDVKKGLRVLAQKSLISLNYFGRIEMHSLLCRLGREIMRKQYSSESRKRQYLDDTRDIDNTDTSSVIGIDLRLSYKNKEITYTKERAFERFPNLHFLRVDGYGANLNSISPKLRYLSWNNFPMPCFPSGFQTKFLVKLDMQYSKLEKLWEGIQPLRNLKWMDLSHSEYLKEVPDLSTAINLKHLYLSYCSSLVRLPSSIESAINLKHLDLSFCSNLVQLPSSIGNTVNPYILNLKYCRSLVKLPFSIGNAINLQELNLCHCSRLVELPYSIGNAINLQKLDGSNCTSLVELPSSIGNATKLKVLYLRFCSSLVKLPSSIGNAMNLKKLNLRNCSSLVELPSSIGNARNLKKLNLRDCSSLVEVPSSIGNAMNLQELKLSGCTRLVELPFSIGNAMNLRKMNLSGCTSLVELPSSIGNAMNLQELNLRDCSSLVELPSSIGNAMNLQELYLSDCLSLVQLPSSIGNAINLQKLDLNRCSRLVELPSSIGNAMNLQKLNISWCSSLAELPSSMKNLRRLSELELMGCSNLEVLLTNINLESLEKLDVSYCSSLKCYPGFFTCIKVFKPSGTTIQEVQELDPWIGRISCLRELSLCGMQKLVSLPQLPDSLVHLDAENCESLERLDSSFRNPDIRLNFANCFKLNQEARDVIIHTATNSFAVLPGGEVPAFFTNRAYGSSLSVKLNQMPLRTSTKFKACIVFDGKDRPEFIAVLVRKTLNCSITSTACTTSSKKLYPVYQKHLYTFEVEAVEVTSTELLFEFELSVQSWKIIECGVFQLLEVHYERGRDGDGDSDMERQILEPKLDRETSGE